MVTAHRDGEATARVQRGRLVVHLALLALLLAPSRAFADEIEPAADAPPRATDAPVVRGTVRIHAHSRKNQHPVRIERSNGDANEVVCASAAPAPPARDAAAVRRPFRHAPWGDCAADVPAGAELRVTLADSTQAHVFVVPDEPGSEIGLEVLPPKPEAIGVGASIAVVAVGGGAAVVGALGVAWWGSGGLLQDSSAATASTVVLVGGVVLALVGVGLLLSTTDGSGEPRVRTEPARRPATSEWRDDAFVRVIAAARPGNLSAVPPPPAPFVFGVAF